MWKLLVTTGRQFHTKITATSNVLHGCTYNCQNVFHNYYHKEPSCLLCPALYRTKVGVNSVHSSYVLLNTPADSAQHLEGSDTAVYRSSDDVIKEVLNAVGRRERGGYCDNEKLSECIKILLNLHWNQDTVINLLCGAPEICRFPLEQFQNQIGYFQDLGFKYADIVKLIHRQPNVIKISPVNINECLRELREIGFTDGKLQKVVARHPQLLRLNPKDIGQRHAQLMTIFRKSDIINLAYRQPCLLTDSWSSIEDRIFYVSEGMGLDQQHILNSDLFCYTLDHIRCRHVFLVRAGLYDKPDKNGNTKIENPTLNQILKTSDEEFTQSVASMTEQELKAFKQIMALEVEQELEREEKMMNEEVVDHEYDSDDELMELKVKSYYRKKPKQK